MTRRSRNLLVTLAAVWVGIALGCGGGGSGPTSEDAPKGDETPGEKAAKTNAEKDVDAEATIAWTDHRLGMGLEFTKLRATDQAGIDDYIQRHFFSNRKA